MSEQEHRWAWRPSPFGPCPRCYWPANTLGPDGQPWHAFCWENAEPPSWWDQFLRREAAKGARREPEPAEVAADVGERQWCATGRRWFDPTPEALEACAEHAAEVTARWTR
jgi:hypothetical protein